MNIIVEDGTIRREISTVIHKFSDSTKKDVLSKTKNITVVIFKDKDGTVYPDGKIVRSDEFVTKYDYEYNKDKDGNILSCRIVTSKMKNGKSIDIEKPLLISIMMIKEDLLKKNFNKRWNSIS